MLEFNSVFRGNTVRILVVEINEVVDLWGMESSWLTDGDTSDGTSMGTWDTTIVVTQVIDGVFSSLLLEFSNS